MDNELLYVIIWYAVIVRNSSDNQIDRQTESLIVTSEALDVSHMK